MVPTVPPHSGHAARRPRLLFVDDDPVVLRAMRRLLLAARPDFMIDSAESVEHALELIERTSYDVVVTDLHMPKSSGLVLLERLKAEHPAIVRVIHSSHVEALSPQLQQELSHAVLRKPSRGDEPLTVLDWAVQQRRRRLRDSANF